MTKPLLQHKHLIVRALVTEPPRDPSFIVAWKTKLIQDIGMRILLGPYAIYSWMEGNRGLTAITAIETSHVALHVWDEIDPALFQLDVYTCSDLDIKVVFDALQQFKPTAITSKFFDREDDISDLNIDFNW